MIPVDYGVEYNEMYGKHLFPPTSEANLRYETTRYYPISVGDAPAKSNVAMERLKAFAVVAAIGAIIGVGVQGLRKKPMGKGALVGAVVAPVVGIALLSQMHFSDT